MATAFRFMKAAYRIPETAEILSLSSRTVVRLLKAGDLPQKKVGRSVLIPAEGIEAFLNGKESGPDLEPDSSRSPSVDPIARDRHGRE